MAGAPTELFVPAEDQGSEAAQPGDSAPLFGRRVRCILDTGAAFKGPAGTSLTTALSVTGLRTKFKIKKTLSREPSCAEIQIYNLSQDSRSSLHSKGTKVIIEAGYADTLARIFSGDSRFITHAQEGADWVTKVDCGDGERVYSFVNFSESFKAGSKAKDVAGRILDSLGVNASQAKRTLSGLAADFLNGRAIHGNAVRSLEKIVTQHGFELSFQDGRPQLLPKGRALDGAAVLLTPSNGLVGSPEYGTSATTPQGAQQQRSNGKAQKRVILKAKSLLQPALRCGGLVRIESRAIQGDFRVESVVHTGDTAAGEWYSELECSPIS